MPEVPQSLPFALFRKRDGMTVPFYIEKIEHAVERAVAATRRDHGVEIDPTLPRRVAAEVVAQLDSPLSEYHVEPDASGQRIPSLEDVQDLVEIVLSEMGQALVVSVFKRYRKQRERSREKIRVRERSNGKGGNLTDAILLVESNSNSVVQTWDRQRIVKQLMDKTGLDAEEAVSVAKAVENQIIGGDVKYVTTALIRELVNTELETRGLNKQLEDLSLYRIPRDFIDQLMFAKSDENSNIVSNNPEAVNLGLAEYLLKQWGLNTIFSAPIREAHRTGAIHLHDLGYPHRVYCSSHSIEYIKKYGLRDLSNLNTESNPARSASVLTGHLNTFLASMQANYAGALGIAYINIFYAPYLVKLNDREVKQVAQELIFNGSQNAFSRGGQTLFLDFNIHTGVPKYLQTVPAIGPGGHYQLRLADGSIAELTEFLLDETDAAGNRLAELRYRQPDGSVRAVLREVLVTRRGPNGEEKHVVNDEALEKDLAARGEAIVTYGDYLPEARRFTSALLDVWGEGDRNGRVFEFPKCDFHIGEETFEDPIQTRIFMQACELASKNGSTYFIFDRDEVTLSACCRLRTTIDDNRMLRHPESMRFCGFQNVTVNIPQAAYRASRKGEANMAGLMKEIEWAMDIAVQAHLEKRDRIAQMMSGPGCPLWQIGRTACDGRPYVELDKATYIIGLIGVNDAVKFLYGKEFHESEQALDLGLEIVSRMYLYGKKLAEKHQLKFTLEESPAESAARRLAKADLLNYHAEAAATVKGAQETPDGDAVYYTNSVHLAADAPVCLVERIEKQGMFHALIESGAITHAFVGEERPSPEAVASLMREVFFRTQSAQVTVSPEFTYCDACGHQARGLLETCPRCQSTKVVGETRVVGYFSKIQNWNKSKRFGELKARQRGIYAVETAEDAAEYATAGNGEPVTAGD